MYLLTSALMFVLEFFEYNKEYINSNDCISHKSLIINSQTIQVLLLTGMLYHN